MTVLATRADGDDRFVVDDDPARLDLDRVVSWVQASYWATGRSREAIERSLAHSHPFGVYTATGEQVGLTRATTDLVSFAWLGDVIVDDAWRGRGVGTWLVATVVEWLRAAGVRRVALVTGDAHEVYRRVGFTALGDPDMWLETVLHPHATGDPVAGEPPAAPA